MFLGIFVFIVGFIMLKPQFAQLEYAISRAEARIAVNNCPPFNEKAGTITKLLCPSAKAVEISREALELYEYYGAKKVNLEFSMSGAQKFKYFVIDEESKKNYSPEILYHIYFWYNYVISWTLSLCLFAYLVKIYSTKIIRNNLKQLGFVQELLYEEAPIAERRASKQADNSEIFDVMDYLIPKVHANDAKRYVENSLRISSKASHVNFRAVGELEVSKFIDFLKKTDDLRLKAVTHYEKELENVGLFKAINKDPSAYANLKKAYASYVKARGSADCLTFAEFIQKKKNITDTGLEKPEVTQMLDYWQKAKTTDFTFAGYCFLNLVHYDKGIFEKVTFFKKGARLNPVKIIHKYFGYSENGKYDVYIKEQRNLENSGANDGGSAREKFDALNADIIREIDKLEYVLTEDLCDYIQYKKFYLKETRTNKKNAPSKIVSEQFPISKIKETIEKAPSPILSLGSDNEDEVKLEKIFQSHYYPDDLSEQYGRILPLPVYIMSPITADSDKAKFFIDGKWQFQSVAGNYFLEVIMKRVLFGFEKNAKDTAAKMKKDAAAAISSAEKDVLLKLAAETEKMLDPKNAAARAKTINEMLAVYRFEETFLIALLKYGRKLLNMPVGILSAKSKLKNPALFYAMTSVDRTYTFNVSYPISLYYEYEKRQAPVRKAALQGEQLKTLVEDHIQEEDAQRVLEPNRRNIENEDKKDNENKARKKKKEIILFASDASDSYSLNWKMTSGRGKDWLNSDPNYWF